MKRLTEMLRTEKTIKGRVRCGWDGKKHSTWWGQHESRFRSENKHGTCLNQEGENSIESPGKGDK